MKLISRMQDSIKFYKILKVSIAALLFLYVFFIPSFGEKSSKLNILVYLAMIGLSLCVFIYCLLFGDFKLNKYVLFIPAFVFIAFIGTAIYSHDFRRWLSLLLLFISFAAFLYALKALNNKFLILHIISIALFLFSAYFIFHYRTELIHFKQFASGSFRLGDYFDNPNGVAAFEVVGFAAPLYLILFYRKKRRFVHLIPLIFSIVVGISTGSRSFILAIGIFLFVLLFFVFKKHKWAYLIALAVLIFGFIGFLQLPFMATIKTRFVAAFQTVFTGEGKTDTATLERTVWLDYGFFLGLKNGIFGYGANGFSIYSGVGTYAHSNYAEVICDFGFIGLILFYFPLVLLLCIGIKEKKVDKSLIFSFVAYYFILSFSNVIYYKKIYYLVLAFLYYLAFYETKHKTFELGRQINKIIFTCDSMGSGGAERVISLLSNGFVDKGVDVTIIGVSDSEEPKSFYSLSNKVNYISLNYGLKKRTRFLRRVLLLRKTILNENPDVVISFLPHVNVYTWFSLFGENIPFVVSERNDPKSDPKGTLIRLLKRMVFSSADGCVFQTNDAMNYYKKSVVEKSVVILNPIITKDEVKHQSKNNTILYVGRFTTQKNLNLLLESFASANQELNEKYVLKIYGDGPLKEELVNKTGELRITDKVIFAGRNDNWQKDEYDDSLFVLSSDYEGMPNSLLEALSLGIPCVSTDCPCGGPKELVNQGFNISLVPVGDSSSLSNAIIDAINNYKQSFDESNIDNSRRFTPNLICEQWLNYFKEL